MHVAAGEFAGTARFQVVRRVGTGGMGVVYEAFDRDQHTTVALKTLRVQTAEALLRLKREFRALQDIHHPNLVSIGELFEQDGTWFFVMEFVSGTTFVDHVRPGAIRRDDLDASAATEPDVHPRAFQRPPLLVDRLRNAAAQLTSGLRALHESGKVHRDIKPSNVLVTPDGRVVLLDFGLVAELDAMPELTGSQVLGTAAYMAPEQAASRPVGPEADWYSLGVLLYECLVGQPPFVGPSLEVLLAKQRRDPRPPQELEPDVPPDLAALAMDLLRFDPLARPGAAEILARLGTAASAPGATARRGATQSEPAPFIGRQREFEVLKRGLEDVRTRRKARIIVVSGESGIGKSALVRRFTQSVADDLGVVLAGRCYERETVPFKGIDGIVDALAVYLQKLTPADVLAIIPPRAALLTQVFPVLRRVDALARLPRQERVEGTELRTRMFGAFRSLLERLAERQTLALVIDDLQWADADSFALLGEIVRPPDAPQLLLITTLRSSSSVDQAVASALPGFEPIVLAPLTTVDAEELARQLMAREHHPAGQSDRIALAAAGHPLFIAELVREAAHYDGANAAGSGELSLEDAIWKRISRLSDDSRFLLELCAVAGAPLDAALAAEAVGLDVATLQRHSAALRVDHLVRTTTVRGAHTMAPYHDRVRDAVLGHLSDDTKRAHHALLARAIESTHRPDPEQVALHHRAAGDSLRARTYAARAADEMMAVLAFERAARLFRWALDPPPNDPGEARRLRVRLADALAKAGRGKDAADEYLASVPGASRADALDFQQRGAFHYLASGHIDEGLAVIRTVLRSVSIRFPESPRAALASLIRGRVVLRLRGLRYQERDESMVPAELLGRLDVCVTIGHGLGLVDNIRGADFQTRALIYALRAGEPARLVRALASEAIFVASQGQTAEQRALDLLDRGDVIYARLGHAPNHLAYLLAARGFVAYQNGRWAEALEPFERALKVLREETQDVFWEIAFVQNFIVWTLFCLGEMAALERRVSAFLKEAEDRGDRFAATNFRIGLPSAAWLVRDEAAVVRAQAVEAVAAWSHQGYHLQHYWGALAQVNALLYDGDGRAALEVLHSQWPALERSMLLRIQRIRVEARDAYARAALAAAEAGHAPRKTLSLAAKLVRKIRRERARYAEAHALALEARIALARGRPEAATDLLSSAGGRFEALRMALHAAAVRRRLGQLVGGRQGEETIAIADRWFAQQGVRRPSSMMRMLAGADVGTDLVPIVRG